MRYILTLLILTSLHIQSQNSMSLAECRALALENNKSHKVVKKRLDLALSDEKSAYAAYTPNIYATATTALYAQNEDGEIEERNLPTKVLDPSTGELKPNIATGADGKPIIKDGNPVFNSYAFLPASSFELNLMGASMAQIILEQPIYVGGKISTAISMAGKAVELSKENIRLSEAQLITNIDKAYYQLLSVKEKLKLAESYKEMLESVTEIVQNSFNVELVNRNDLLKSQVALNNAKLSLQEAKHGLVLSKMNLCRIMNMEYSSDFTIQDSLSEINLNQEFYEHSLDNRSEYKMLQTQLKLFDDKVDMARSDFLPQIGVQASFGYINGVEFNDTKLSGHSINALLNVKVPIFNWFERFNKVDKARLELKIQEYEFEEKADLMKLEISKNEFGLKDAISRYTISLEALAQADENMRISEDNYKLGNETISDMLKAKAQWQEIHSKLIDAKIQVKIKRTEYLKSLGMLN